jgi:hypothetical protein
LRRRLISLLTAAALPLGLIVATGFHATASGVAYGLGDVFAGVGHGIINHYNNQGTLLDTLNTTSNSSEDTGMCFDALGNLRSTNWTANNMTQFDNMGNVTKHPWGGPFSSNPESCVLNSTSTNVFVGQAGGSRQILEFDTSGNFVKSFSPATGNRGTDWIDLAADQSTMFYTSEDNQVRTFNVTTNMQGMPFATSLPSSPCYALRLRTGGDVMVACSNAVLHLSSSGLVVKSYLTSTYSESSFFFALNLDPDGTSFWTAGYSSGNIYRIDIASGNLIKKFHAPITVSLAGLAVFGEPTVGGPPPMTDAPITGAQGVNISSTEGQSFMGPVATFSDPDLMATSAEYSATIAWGDMVTSPGTVSGGAPMSPGKFTVTGSHTYLDEGLYTVKVTITDVDNPSNTATTGATANIADAALTSACATPPVSAQAFAGPTATFTDAYKASTTADFTATIDWGDGTTSPGTVSGSGATGYTVTGTHVYSSTGNFTITTKILDDGGSTTTTKPGCTVLIGGFPTSNGGTFVVGDLEATGTGAALTWWSSQWAQINLMSGGPAPSSMKGFAGFEDMPLPAGITLTKLCGQLDDGHGQFNTTSAVCARLHVRIRLQPHNSERFSDLR